VAAENCERELVAPSLSSGASRAPRRRCRRIGPSTAPVRRVASILGVGHDAELGPAPMRRRRWDGREKEPTASNSCWQPFIVRPGLFVLRSAALLAPKPFEPPLPTVACFPAQRGRLQAGFRVASNRLDVAEGVVRGWAPARRRAARSLQVSVPACSAPLVLQRPAKSRHVLNGAAGTALGHTSRPPRRRCFL